MMYLAHKMEGVLNKLADGVQAIIPRHQPTLEKLKRTKIISHRGEYDNVHVFENTLDAFEAIAKAGVWGMEFDIRWTKDLEPVVFHDSGCKRLFDRDVKIKDLSLTQIRQNFPVIPSLEEVVERYGKKLHLMVELKAEYYPKPILQREIMKDIFSKLSPGEDYHFISLTPDMFQFVDFVPKKTCFPVAFVMYEKMSELALLKGYGGVLGHYQVLSKKRIATHKANGQKVGVGYIASKNSLFREVNRGIEWLFSNDAVEIQRLLEQLCCDMSSL